MPQINSPSTAWTPLNDSPETYIPWGQILLRPVGEAGRASRSVRMRLAQFLMPLLATLSMGGSGCQDPPPAPVPELLTLNLSDLPAAARTVEAFIDGQRMGCQLQLDSRAATCSLQVQMAMTHDYQVSVFDALGESQPDYGCRLGGEYRGSLTDGKHTMDLSLSDATRQCKVTVTRVSEKGGTFYIWPSLAAKEVFMSPRYFPVPTDSISLTFEFVPNDNGLPPIMHPRSATDTQCNGQGYYCLIAIRNATEISVEFQ